MNIIKPRKASFAGLKSFKIHPPIIDGGFNYPLETRKSQTIIVGYTHGDYPYKRNIVGIVPNVEYKKIQDLFTTRIQLLSATQFL